VGKDTFGQGRPGNHRADKNSLIFANFLVLRWAVEQQVLASEQSGEIAKRRN
jgi:hypothetical protein